MPDHVRASVLKTCGHSRLEARGKPEQNPMLGKHRNLTCRDNPLAVQGKQDGKAAGRQLNVMSASVSSGCEDASRQHCFTVHSTEEGTPSGKTPMFELQADGTAEQQEWMTSIQVCLQPIM